MSAFKRCFGFPLIAILLMFFFASCAPKKIAIGFAADLTGSNSALGVDGRDGAQLAVEQINAQGGVAGRRIELVTRNDFGTEQGAVNADRELIEQEGVKIIVGHMTSAQTIAAWEEFKNSGVIFVSPTASTPALAGLDDNFFRLIVVNSLVAERLAMYAANDLALKRVAIFMDADNAAFAKPYQETFTRIFEANGGKVVFLYEYSSRAEPNFVVELNAAKAKLPDGMFIIASAFDAALIAQRARLEGIKARLFTTNWAFTSDLIENGGGAVEGMFAVVSHNENNQSPAYLAFGQAYFQRYGRKPTFASAYGYETILMIAAALEQTNGETQGLKESLLKTSIIGLNGVISFDPYGDVSRPLYLIAVQDGNFINVETFSAP